MSSPSPFAEIIIPLAVGGVYTYALPEHLQERVKPGSRVLIPFGKRRIYTGVISALIQDSPEGFTPKEILDVLDDIPHVLPAQLQLWDWMSSYYMCRPGDVMRAALPSGLRPESESRVIPNMGFEDDGSLDSFERLLLEVVKDQGEVNIGDLEMTGISDRPLKVLKQLIEKGAVEINEKVRQGLRKRSVSYIQLSSELSSEEALHQTLDKLGRAPRQKELLERYLQLCETDQGGDTGLVMKSLLISNPSYSGALNTLVKKGVLEQITREEMKKGGKEDEPGKLNELNSEQTEALASVKEQFQKQQCVLLHGVTSSGKTELYIHLIREYLDRGQQVLYLLPEIALTTQIIERVRRVFGSRVGVYHSRYSDSERVHVYRNLLGLTDEEPYGVLIGVRSALFLPYSALGLVIIDEEHENTYKQHDPAPRYHARDTAQILALFHGARVLLGTATPSFESLYNAKSGKYGYATINGRFGAVQQPEVILANTRTATHRKQMHSHFTPQLLEGIREAIELGEQVILFQNRRGYSHYIVCNDCGEIPKCSRCDVSLTYHRISRKLECHYCGYKENMPSACPSCSNTNMSMKGFGTEKIEDELPHLIEGAKIGRLDTDTARSQRGVEKVLGDFASGNLNVLIGTQMVSKGLDFARVSLVGVMDADSMLHFPDFRAFERSYQLITQVSGRAGRRKKRGKVIIQTSDPDHPVINQILRGDYENLFNEQMEERELFGYPPFTRMIRITFRHKIPSILDGATDLVGNELKSIFASRVYGPQYPPVRKIHNSFIKQIILKIERKASVERAKDLLTTVLTETLSGDVYRSVRVSVDVDPY